MPVLVEDTPNPETKKFLWSLRFLSTPIAYSSLKDVSENDAWREVFEKIFAHTNVKSIFVGQTFLSITKKSEASWDTLISPLQNLLSTFETQKAPTTGAEENLASRTQDYSPEIPSPFEADSIEAKIHTLLVERIRPYVAQDGGDIALKKFEKGVAYVEMHGACSGCPSATATLKQGVENLLTYYIPEVLEVQAI